MDRLEPNKAQHYGHSSLSHLQIDLCGFMTSVASFANIHLPDSIVLCMRRPAGYDFESSPMWMHVASSTKYTATLNLGFLNLGLQAP